MTTSANDETLTLFGDERDELDVLRRRYQNLVNIELPQLARESGWCLVENHCFARVILDNLFETPWYEALGRSKTPAYARLTTNQLRKAIAIAESIPKNLDELNARSLQWRGKKAHR